MTDKPPIKIIKIGRTKNFHADARDRFLMETLSVEAEVEEGKATEGMEVLLRWLIMNGPQLEGNPITDTATVGGTEVKAGSKIQGTTGYAEVTGVKKASIDWTLFDYSYDLPYAKKGFDMEAMRNKVKKSGGVFNGTDKKWYSYTYYDELREFVTCLNNKTLPPPKQVSILKADGTTQTIDTDDIPDSWEQA